VGPGWRAGIGPVPLPLGAALLLTLGLLLLHAGSALFVCDDAYISFRYARNLASGAGLVFNPGDAPVEGYTNFLWVLLLAAGSALGAAPERLAPALSLAATVALWALVAGYALRDRPAPGQGWLVVVPPLLLAATRSVAVWSSGGLETRLFELLVLGGTLRLSGELSRLLRGEAPGRPGAALLLALATLTRPDGLLVALSLGAAALLVCRPLPRAWLARSALLFAALVGAHLAFRIAYYGDLVPNTFHAKVGGRLWPTMGLAYLGMFALEYGLWLWVPFWWAGLRFHRRRGTGRVPLLFGAAVLPHLAYVVAIGGDHFEYRPLGLALPFACLLLYDGARALVRGPRSAAAVAAGLAVCLALLAEIPLRLHREFPRHYTPGFPGSQVSEQGADFLNPTRSWLYRLPGLRALAGLHLHWLHWTTGHFVAVRAEEHRVFMEKVLTEARILRELVRRGTIPADTFIAIDSVGAIPYFSNLRTLDRLGLTDAEVALGEFRQPELMGHGKAASLDYARGRGVDLWAVHPVHLLWKPGDPGLQYHLEPWFEAATEVHFAHVGEDFYLLAWLPQGPEQARRRFPRLHFKSAFDPAQVPELLGPRPR
jgi:hypothetical protein